LYTVYYGIGDLKVHLAEASGRFKIQFGVVDDGSQRRREKAPYMSPWVCVKRDGIRHPITRIAHAMENECRGAEPLVGSQRRHYCVT
jgi:hypothetical protein